MKPLICMMFLWVVTGPLCAQVARSEIKMSFASFCVGPPSSITPLIDRADLVAVVRILESESFMERSLLYGHNSAVTHFTALLEDSLTSRPNLPIAGDLITIKEPGGVTHFDGQLFVSNWNGSANLIPTKRYLLFLTKADNEEAFVVTIGKFGAFRLIDDRVLPHLDAKDLTRQYSGVDLEGFLWEIENQLLEKDSRR